jgi:hypothetical protein
MTGVQFTPNQWMHSTIDAIWTFTLTLWRQRNHKLHGHNEQIFVKAKCQKSLIRATALYHDTLDDDESSILHSTPVANMINWTKQHLDAYTLPPLKWVVNGMLSLVSFFLSCAVSLYAVWGGSHMVCTIMTSTFHLQIQIFSYTDKRRSWLGH